MLLCWFSSLFRMSSYCMAPAEPSSPAHFDETINIHLLQSTHEAVDSSQHAAPTRRLDDSDVFDNNITCARTLPADWTSTQHGPTFRRSVLTTVRPILDTRPSNRAPASSLKVPTLRNRWTENSPLRHPVCSMTRALARLK